MRRKRFLILPQHTTTSHQANVNDFTSASDTFPSIFLEDIQIPQRNVYEKRYKFTLDMIRYEIIMDFDFSILLLPSPLWWRCKMWNISDSRRYKIGFTSESSYRYVSSFVETFYNLITALSLLRENDHMSYVVVPTKRGSARSGREHTHT